MTEDSVMRADRTDHPVLDEITASTGIARIDRAVIGLSDGVADAIAFCVERGRSLTLLTPRSTRLTYPLRSALRATAGSWVAQTGDGYFDALSGTPVDREPDGFVARAGAAGSFVEGFLPERPPAGAQLIVTMTVQHQASARTRLGEALALVTEALTGHGPAGWGVSEPVTQPWNTADLTTLARRRMPAETRLIAVGRPETPFIATIHGQRTAVGLDEDIVLLLPAPTGAAAAGGASLVRDTLIAIADRVTLAFATAHLRRARTDLTSPAEMEGLPAPVALVLGPRAVRQIGLDYLERSPLPGARRIGRPRVPGLMWALTGDAASWGRALDFVQYLGPDRLTAASPELAERLHAAFPDQPPPDQPPPDQPVSGENGWAGTGVGRLPAVRHGCLPP